MIGDIIKKLRTEKGLTSKQLAELTNLTPAYLSMLENGKRNNPSTEILQSIASALNIPMSTFFDSEEKITNKDSLTSDNIIDEDIRRIERARTKMTPKDKEKMMKILRSAFDDFFDD